MSKIENTRQTFLNKAAEAYASSTPAHDFSSAYRVISEYVEKLRNQPSGGWVSFGGFFLYKWEEEGSVEYFLTRKVLTLAEFSEDSEAYVVGA